MVFESVSQCGIGAEFVIHNGQVRQDLLTKFHKLMVDNAEDLATIIVCLQVVEYRHPMLRLTSLLMM